MAYKLPYDLKKVRVDIGVSSDAFPVEGIQSIGAEFDTDRFSLSKGADGFNRQVENNDRGGTITITLAAGSPSHQLIMALDSVGLSFPIAVVDKTSLVTNQALVFGDGCRLSVKPPFAREAEESDVEYVFVCETLVINHSGAGEES